MAEETSEGKDKVLPEGERITAPVVVAETQAPTSEDADVLTRAELATKFEELATRARAAGISPLHAMAQTYTKRAMAVLDSILSALEEAPKKTPDETEKKV